MIIIRLITVYTKKTITADIPAIGLHSTAKGSEFRWSEAPVDTGLGGYVPVLTNTGDITTKVDFSGGGNIEQYNVMSFSIVNLSQINILMEDMDFTIVGSRVICVDYYPATSESKIVYSGIIDTFSADDREIDFECESEEFKKDRNLSTKIYVGSDGNFPLAPEGVNDQIIPLCFGESDPENGRFFKIPCTKNKHSFLTQQQILDLIEANPQYENYPGSLGYFPLIPMYTSETEGRKYHIMLGDIDIFDVTQEQINRLVGKYLFIKTAPINSEEEPLATESSENQMRMIIEAEVIDAVTISITVDKMYPTNLYGDTTFNHSYQSYAQILDRGINPVDPSEYIFRTGSFSSLGFKNEEKYYYGGSEKKLILNNGLDIHCDPTTNNEIYFKNILIPSEENKIAGFKFVSVPTLDHVKDVDLQKYDAAEFDQYGEPWDEMNLFKKKIDGLYVYEPRLDDIYYTYNTSPIINNTDNRSRNVVRYYSDANTGSNSASVSVQHFRAWKFTLPFIDFDFDEMYLGISMYVNCQPTEGDIWTINHYPEIGIKKFMGAMTWAMIDSGEVFNILHIENLPDSYYTDYSDHNKAFIRYGEKSAVEDEWWKITGFNNFKFEDVKNKNDYEMYTEGVILLPRILGPDDHFVDQIIIRKLAVVFKSNAEIGDYLYV